MEEVVVTARKREEVVVDIPIAITVLDASLIHQQTATEFRDLWANIPNASMDVTGNSFSSWGLRGIVSQTRNPGQESGLGVYVDRVYMGRPGGFNVPMHDIEQIEVLRGPQGSLFGRNTIAGAVNISTRQPTTQLHSWLQGSFGNLSRVDLQAGVSGPLTDDGVVLGKISVFSFQRDGYVDNLLLGTDLQGEDRQGVRGSLTWSPADQVELTLNADWMTQDNTLMAGETLEPQLNNFVPGWSLPGNQVNQNDPGYDRIDAGGLSVILDWDFAPEWRFSSISAWRITDLETLVDDDAGPITLTWSNFNDDTDSFTQEFLFSGALSDRAELLVGLYYLDIDIDSHRVTGLFTPYPARPAAITSDSMVDTRSWALFASTDVDLTDRWTLTAGLRYTDERKRSHFVQTENGGLGFPNVTFNPTINDDSVSGDLSLTWSVTDHVNLYGSVRKGFKSGGFQTDIINFASEDLFVFGPEEALAWELGLKGTFLDDRLSADLAVFTTDYDDMQVGQLVGLGFTTTNAGKSDIDGFELQIDYLPLDNLRLGLRAGWLDAQFTEFDQCVGPGTSCAGNALQYAPDSTWAAEIAYTFPLEEGGGLEFYLGANYRDSYFLNAVNDPQLKIDERTLMDGRVAYTTPNGRWTVALWARNLGDEDWDLTRWQYPVTPLAFGALDPTLTGAQRTPAEPRTYGVEILFRY